MEPRPRLLRDLADRDDYDDTLADLCALLIDALHIDEVRAAVTDAVAAEQFRRDTWAARTAHPASPVAGPVRDRQHRRGGR